MSDAVGSTPTAGRSQRSIAGHLPILSPQRYAAQRRLGFRRLRFSETLEQEFRARRVRGSRLSALRTAGLALLAMVAYLALDRLGSGEPRLYGRHQLWFAMSVLGLVAIGVQAYRLRPLDRVEARMLPPVLWFGLSAAGLLLSRAHQGADAAHEALLLAVVGVYFAFGLLFRAALFAGLLCSLAWVVGTLLLDAAGPRFQFEVLFTALANVLGAAGLYQLEYAARRNFLLQGELAGLAMRDGLTRLMNRRAFRRHLSTVWRQSRRERRCVGLLLLDVDHFKAVNDRHGHLLGDRSLRHVATVLSQLQRRPLDAAARLGGDEFAGLWFDVDRDWFVAMVSELRTTIERRSEADTTLPTLTVSIGAVVGAPDGHGAMEALHRADENLYVAKRGGRNQARVTPLTD